MVPGYLFNFLFIVIILPLYGIRIIGIFFVLMGGGISLLLLALKDLGKIILIYQKNLQILDLGKIHTFLLITKEIGMLFHIVIMLLLLVDYAIIILFLVGHITQKMG